MWARTALAVALRGPGKVLLLVSAAGWVAMWLQTAGADAHAGRTASHAHRAAGAAWSIESWAGAGLVWAAMIVAMGPPLLRREVGVVWRTTLRRRRAGAIALFAAGYAAVWLLAGLVLVPAAAWASAGRPRAATALALTALWHCSPLRQRLLNACHRTPCLPVFGAAARWGALRYGIVSGSFCVAACGLLMLLVLLAGAHHLLAMAGAAAVATVERHLPARRPRWQVPVIGGRRPEPPLALLDRYPAGVSA